MTIAEHHAPSWVADLLAADPTVTLRLLVHNSTQVIDLVRDGSADLGFIESPQVPTSLASRQIGWDRLVVAVVPGHPWAATDSQTISADELSRTPLLVREPGSGTRETLQEAMAALGLELVTSLEMDSNTALTSAAVSGSGPVVLSEMALRSEVASGRLVLIDVDGLPLRRPLTAIWRRDAMMHEGAAALFRVVLGQSENDGASHATELAD